MNSPNEDENNSILLNNNKVRIKSYMDNRLKHRSENKKDEDRNNLSLV